MFLIRSRLKKIKFWKMTLKILGWKTTLHFFKAVLGSPWIALPMLQSKFYWNKAISLLSRVGGWLCGGLELRLKPTQFNWNCPFKESLAKFQIISNNTIFGLRGTTKFGQHPFFHFFNWWVISFRCSIP